MIALIQLETMEVNYRISHVDIKQWSDLFIAMKERKSIHSHTWSKRKLTKKKREVQWRRLSELESNVISTGLAWTEWERWEWEMIGEEVGSKLYRLLATSSSLISGTASRGRRTPFFRVSKSTESLSKNVPIDFSSLIGWINVDDGVIVLETIDSRQRGIVVTLAKETIESVILSCGDDGRIGATGVDEISRCWGRYRGVVGRSLLFRRLARHRSVFKCEQSPNLNRLNWHLKNAKQNFESTYRYRIRGKQAQSRFESR